jgi:hypothetical protein
LSAQLLVTTILGLAGLASAAVAITHERRMHRHRQPGVSYGAATLRRDGGWRRKDLFTDDGLRAQAQAAKFGFLAAALWVVALIAFVALAAR